MTLLKWVNCEKKGGIFMFRLSHLTTQKIIAVYRIKFNEESISKNTRRKADIFVLALNGKINLHQGRRKRVVEPGKIGLIPLGSVFKIDATLGSECIMVEFISNDVSLMSPEVFPIGNVEEVQNAFVQMEKKWSKKTTGYVQYCLEKFYFVVGDLCNVQEKALLANKHLDIIQASLDYIDEHYLDNDISNESIALQSGISVVYFRKIFTSSFHVSPMKYVQNLRMEKAKELLLSGLVSVTDIAKITGFSSIYSFSKTFKTAVGCSPLQYSE